MTETRDDSAVSDPAAGTVAESPESDREQRGASNSERASERETDGSLLHMPWVILATLLLSAAAGFAFRPTLAGTGAFWAAVAIPNFLAAAWALHYLHREDLLFERLRPRGGDISLGALVGVGLLVASWAGRTTLVAAGTPQQAWLLNIYIQIGDPEVVQSSVLMTVLLLSVVLAEELFWRGWVLDACSKRVGPRRGWMLATLLYAATLLPTVVTLAAPLAGPNPMLFVAALFCGLVWTFMAHVIGRLPPVILAHAVFTYFSVVQFRLPGT